MATMRLRGLQNWRRYGKVSDQVSLISELLSTDGTYGSGKRFQAEARLVQGCHGNMMERQLSRGVHNAAVTFERPLEPRPGHVKLQLRKESSVLLGGRTAREDESVRDQAAAAVMKAAAALSLRPPLLSTAAISFQRDHPGLSETQHLCYMQT
ncbi:hypothetical protein FQA47_015087 [Oryzias melastigma]|uniref:Uncharacterized protein n=1 Tax=Oryzias melastigma TaxID=30732 RepID=A0A834KZV1_ORYME|nr:hypothetical protein FQA47_015087 [Oryzias melastigma]